MSIIDGVEVQPTRDERLVEIVNVMKENNKDAFGSLVRNFINQYNVLWNNTEGYTAQEILNGFGADATSLFQLAGLVQNLVNTVSPDTLTQLPLQTPTFNEDGTVNLS